MTNKPGITQAELGTVFRGRYYPNISSITACDGTILATRGADGSIYTIDGGRRLGGSSRDWFLSGPDLCGSINCTSVRDALKLVDGL